MRIRDVLAAKGNKVVTIWPAKTLDQILKLLDDRRISSAVVVDTAGQPLGLVDDRCVLRALAQEGKAAFQRTAEQLMIRPIPSCGLDDTLASALYEMTQSRVRHLVVLEGGRMAGLVSIGDLVKARLDDAEMEGRVLRDLALGRIAAAAG
jgi:CBS domain-containing protein